MSRTPISEIINDDCLVAMRQIKTGSVDAEVHYKTAIKRIEAVQMELAHNLFTPETLEK